MINCRKPNWFIRICLILMIAISLFSIIFSPLCIIPILLLIQDVKKCKSYIKFTKSSIIIDNYIWWFLNMKHIYQKIPYCEINNCKCFYDEIRRGRSDNSHFDFNIYLKNGRISTFTVGQNNLVNLDISKTEWFFKKKNVKFCIT